jgi:hypothetical protein
MRVGAGVSAITAETPARDDEIRASVGARSVQPRLPHPSVSGGRGRRSPRPPDTPQGSSEPLTTRGVRSGAVREAGLLGEYNRLDTVSEACFASRSETCV